ncbi:MAG: TIGR01777 family oxidoreductase [Proteobacteria bacterium]|nr:TIGR01777 family oxidoreductase [Pseudomonadota bacterium]
MNHHDQKTYHHFITGGSGLIGTSLVQRLAEAGHSGTILSRKSSLPPSSQNTSFSLLQGDIRDASWCKHIKGHHTIINLAGFPLFQHRWNAKTKQLIQSSRIQGSHNIADYVLSQPPSERCKHLIQASAVGYYGTSLTEKFDESSPAGHDYLADVAQKWEQQALRLKGAIDKVTIMRIGIVLSTRGGMIKKVLPIFQKGLGGRLGSGKQWVSWIHIHDLTAALYQACTDSHWQEGVYNLTSPHPVTNSQLTKALSKHLKLPAFFPVAKTFLKAVLGEGANYITQGQYVIASKDVQQKFHYQYPHIDEALAHLIKTKN